jgi:hypothetical protein
MIIGGGGCGGIVASNVFRQQDAPNYTYVPLNIQAKLGRMNFI